MKYLFLTFLVLGSLRVVHAQQVKESQNDTIDKTCSGDFVDADNDGYDDKTGLNKKGEKKPVTQQ